MGRLGLRACLGPVIYLRGAEGVTPLARKARVKIGSG